MSTSCSWYVSTTLPGIPRHMATPPSFPLRHSSSGLVSPARRGDRKLAQARAPAARGAAPVPVPPEPVPPQAIGHLSGEQGIQEHSAADDHRGEPALLGEPCADLRDDLDQGRM